MNGRWYNPPSGLLEWVNIKVKKDIIPKINECFILFFVILKKIVKGKKIIIKFKILSNLRKKFNINAYIEIAKIPNNPNS
jgi:hypothetical protein